MIYFYSCTKNVKIAAKHFKDRPMTPQESVLYWTEYVLRHSGAHHLKSEALNLTWYQYLLLDVNFFVVVSFLVVTYLINKVTRQFYLSITKYLNKIKVKKE